MAGHELLGLVVAGLGFFVLLGAAFNWDWFFSLRAPRMIESLLGRIGARIVYCLLGVLFVVMGVDVATKPPSRKTTEEGKTRTTEADSKSPTPAAKPRPSERDVVLSGVAVDETGHWLSASYRFREGGPIARTKYYLVVENAKGDLRGWFLLMGPKREGVIRVELRSGVRDRVRAYLATGSPPTQRVSNIAPIPKGTAP